MTDRSSHRARAAPWPSPLVEVVEHVSSQLQVGDNGAEDALADRLPDPQHVGVVDVGRADGVPAGHAHGAVSVADELRRHSSGGHAIAHRLLDIW